MKEKLKEILLCVAIIVVCLPVAVVTEKWDVYVFFLLLPTIAMALYFLFSKEGKRKAK